MSAERCDCRKRCPADCAGGSVYQDHGFWDTCSCCDGRGFVTDPECQDCGGKGEIEIEEES